MEYKDLSLLDRVHYQLLVRWLEAIKGDNFEDAKWYAEGMKTVESVIPDITVTIWAKIRNYLGV